MVGVIGDLPREGSTSTLLSALDQVQRGAMQPRALKAHQRALRSRISDAWCCLETAECPAELRRQVQPLLKANHDALERLEASLSWLDLYLERGDASAIARAGAILRSLEGTPVLP
ncbi:MAG: hypothetical protein HY319_28405 [Armatimonadetes bacterium]|nr:hypothetical protein [Armatimonadota bacterium]